MSSKLLFILFSFVPSLALGQSLEHFFEQAINNTGTIIQKDLDTKIALEQKGQAYSQVLPTIAAESSNVWREQANVGAFGQAYQHTALISLNQPLFQGGSEYYDLAIARQLPKIAELEKQRQLRLLYADIAQAFFQTLRAQRDIQLYSDQEKSLKDRIKTLSARVRIGRSKPTELLAARSRLSRILAERSQSQRQKIISENLLKTLTGVDRIGELEDLVSPEKLTYDNRWDTQINKTPQIQATQLLLENAKRSISSARGTYLPTVDANANYYLERAGILQDSSWDVTVNARWELYQGGNDSSEVQVRKLQADQINSQLSDIKRTQKNEFESLKSQFEIHQKALKEFDEAVNLAKRNYDEFLKEADRGLVSDLDALQALDDYLAVRKTYIQQIYETKITWAQIKALVGDLPRSDS